jgi:hypothetical protein
MKKIMVIRIINSYTGKDDWGYDCVEGSDGNIYYVRQKPDSNWKVGDDIMRAKKTFEPIKISLSDLCQIALKEYLGKNKK